MSRLFDLFAWSRARHAARRAKRALRYAFALAPTQESVHELEVIAARRR